MRVVCSAGTYIRSLAHDLGTILNVGAHLTALRRTRSGVVSETVNWQTLLAAFEAEVWRQFVLDETLPLRDLPTLLVDDETVYRLQRGQAVEIRAGQSLPNFAPIRVYDSRKRLIAIGERSEGRIRPVKVFRLATS